MDATHSSFNNFIPHLIISFCFLIIMPSVHTLSPLLGVHPLGNSLSPLFVFSFLFKPRFPICMLLLIFLGGTKFDLYLMQMRSTFLHKLSSARTVQNPSPETVSMIISAIVLMGPMSLVLVLVFAFAFYHLYACCRYIYIYTDI